MLKLGCSCLVLLVWLFVHVLVIAFCRRSSYYGCLTGALYPDSERLNQDTKVNIQLEVTAQIGSYVYLKALLMPS